MSALAIILAGSLLAQVDLRAGDAPPGKPVSVTLDGIAYAQEGSPPVLVGLDRVRSVSGELAPRFAEFQLIADHARRARLRLERGDTVNAEPLLDELFARYSDRAGPTATFIAEGLLWCRLTRGAQSSAVVPWLVWLRASPQPVTLSIRPKATGSASESAWRGPSFAFDTTTGLVPSLPPIWLDVPATQVLARTPELLPPLDPSFNAPAENTRVVLLGEWYRAAAAFECGAPPAAFPGESSDAAVGLVSDIVRARIGNDDQREQARVGLRRRLAGKCEPWTEAWIRAALGRSLLRETSAELRRVGIAELAYLPARMPDESPYLTGVALAEAAVALNKLSDRAAADRLRDELTDQFAGHPALDWPALRSWPRPARQTPALQQQ